MKHYYYCFLLFCSTSVLAQPTITSAVIPVIGSSSTYRTFNAENVMPGDSGVNVIWDYFNINITGTGIYDYKDPAIMPNGNLYSKANLGLDRGGDPQVYLISDNQQFSAVGIEFAGLNENYDSDPKELIRFPISYGTQFIESFEGNVVLGTLNATRKGDIVITGDGYGTLILPLGTFLNVLRVRTISTYDDEFLGNNVNSGIDTVYTWYQTGVKDNVFSWSHITSSLAGDVFYGAYLDTVYVGIDSESSDYSKFLISPNPAQDVIVVEFESHNSDLLILDILDLSGKLIKRIELNNKAGFIREEINVRDLNKGIYTLSVKGRNGAATKLFVIN